MVKPVERDFAELDHLEYVLRLVPLERYGLAVDVGAHNGLYAARIAMDFKKVLAFEPATDMCRVLRARVSGFSNVTVIQAACGAEDARGTLVEDDKRSGRTRCRYAIFGAEGKVPAVTLDSAVPKEERVDFLKIDVEGAEEFVLKGAQGLLARDHPLIMIESLEMLANKHYGLSSDGVARFLEKLGAVKIDEINQDHVYAWR